MNLNKIEELKIGNDYALIVVDMQNDFLPGGALEVPKGDQIIDGINELSDIFKKKNGFVIFTQDWHPTGHLSFASSYNEKKPGDPIKKPGLGPILWPDHCIQNTNGAKISDKIKKENGICIIRKGYHKKIDSYSGFFNNDKKSKTGLTGLLRDLNIKKVYICGLALDYCCYFTAIDSKTEGFDTYFIKNLTRGIDQPEKNIENTIKDMEEKGIEIL